MRPITNNVIRPMLIKMYFETIPIDYPFGNSSHCQPPNGVRYPLVGGTGQCHFAGTNSKPANLPKNAQTPTCRVHAVLGGDHNAISLSAIN
jgi:hypothetical protein